MTEFIKLQILALLQGLTEFLPVSSSGHLSLMRHWLGIEAPADCAGALEVVLHAGTLLSVLFYYRKRIVQLVLGLVRREAASWRYAMALILSTIPAGIFYFAAGDWLDSLFGAPLAVSLLLMLTGVILLSLRKAPPAGDEQISWQRGLIIGAAQAFAILPGISRSGSTYVTSRWLKISPAEAFDFSFLMSIPVIAGAILLKADEISTIANAGMTSALICAAMVAALTGLAALKLLAYIRIAGKFHCFGWYCLAAGAIATVSLLLA